MEAQRDAGESYVITIRGRAGPATRAAFEDLELTVTGDMTLLRVCQGDQAALHGVLQRIRDLGLDVIEVQRTVRPT